MEFLEAVGKAFAFAGVLLYAATLIWIVTHRDPPSPA